MRKVHIDNLVPGAILARPIYTTEGRILLSEGITLKQAYINKIHMNSIYEIYIEDEMSSGVDVQDIILEQTRNEAKQLVRDFMSNTTLSKTLNSEEIKALIDNIINQLLENDEIIINLSDIKSVDDYTFEHSVNVCIISLVIGMGLGYTRPKLKDLGVGAILHDIGKLRIPAEILKKPSQLTVQEFEEIKKHSYYGYEILKKNPRLSMVSSFIALGHHERFDGSGYPLQLKGENIHQCARIVAVADVFDALSSDRVYRKKLRPHEVIEYITSLGSHHFDPEIVESFIKYVALYPAGTGAVLNTMEKVLVVKDNRNFPTKPVVRVIYSADGIMLDEPYEIDLSERNDIFINDAYELGNLDM